MTLQHMDTLFVINQDFDPAEIQAIVSRDKVKCIVFLSSHYLFRNERERLLEIAPKGLFRMFADFLNDQEMQSCDDRASKRLNPFLWRRNIRKKYMTHFTQQSMWNKNELVYQKLSRTYHMDRIFYTDGLGIHGGFWRSVGGLPLSPSGPIWKMSNRLFIKWPAAIRRLVNVFRSNGFYTVCHEKCCFVFLSSIKRLKFSHQAPLNHHTCALHRWILFHLLPFRKRTILKGMLRYKVPEGYRTILCSTIHEYYHALSELEMPIYIFVDGYHPPNYPRSYIDMYATDDIVIRHMFDEQWFQKSGKRTHRPPPFIQASKMRSIVLWPQRPIRTVLLVLNHAGDWTSLINRSDTDRLIEAFADASEQFPHLSFIIRPHPTMATPEHEGAGSLERISKYVSWRGIHNLSVSRASLMKDMERAELFVSEYSQVLIDAFEVGKLGIIVNVTGRRSFMIPYEELGFFSANSLESFIENIRDIDHNPREAAQKQNHAAEQYNRILKEGGYIAGTN